jgi:hypothetical protein
VHLDLSKAKRRKRGTPVVLVARDCVFLGHVGEQRM